MRVVSTATSLCVLAGLFCTGPACATFFDANNNLVVNGNAEGSFNYWFYVVNGSIATSDSASVPGTNSFQANAAGANYAEIIHDPIAVTTGQRVRFQLAFKTLSGATMGTGGAMAFLRYFNSAMQWLGQDVISLGITNGVWQQFQGEFTVYQNAQYVDIYIAVGKWGAFDGTARFDDAAIFPKLQWTGGSNFFPADNTKFSNNTPVFTWTASPIAESFDIYLGTELDKVRGAQRLLGDLSLNGSVDIYDLAITALYWLQSPTALVPSPDLKPDGQVNMGDFSVLADKWATKSEAFKINTNQTFYSSAPLTLGHTYYWRIDEVNGPNISPGEIQTINVSYSVLDGMEAYDSNNLIHNVWKDGRYNNTGSTVSVITNNVHEGLQALSYAYDNSGSVGQAYYSEIQRQFDTPQDWNGLGAELLWVHFYGNPNNIVGPNEYPYLALEDDHGTRVRVPYDNRHGTLSDIQRTRWQLWQVGLTDFNGVDLTCIKKIAIGFGDPNNPTPGGTGLVYFDDIHLLAQQNQLFPAGPPPAASIDEVDLRYASADTILAAVTLQGHVNGQSESHLYYLLNSQDLFWLDRAQEKGYFSNVSLKSIDVVFAEYSDYYDKVIIYDPALPATINIATMIASVERGVVINASDLGRFGSGKEVVDIRGQWKTNIEAYQWAFDNLWPRMSHNVLASYHPTATSHHIRDYLVQNRIFTFWVTGQNAEDGIVSNYNTEKAFAEQLFAQMPINTPIIGWWSTLDDDGLTEYGGVGLSGQYGKLTFACDWTTNMSILSGITVDWSEKIAAYNARPVPPAPALDPNKVYIAIVMIDAGDAPVYWQQIQQFVWQDSTRGDFPINWSLAPGSLELLPHIMEYFYEQTTGNDLFFIAPSGSGYVHPYRNFMAGTTDSEQAWAAYIALTNYYMKFLNVRDMSLYTDAFLFFDRAANDPLTLRFVNGLENMETLILGMGRNEGITDYNYRMGGNNALVSHTTTRWDTANIGRNPANNQWLINEVLANTPAQRPAFMMVYPLSWSYYPSDLAQVLSGLGPEYVPVSLRDFKALYKEAE